MTMMDEGVDESLIEEPTIEDERCKLLIQGLNTKDEKIILDILNNDNEEEIKVILEKLPAHHVRSLVIQLRNLVSSQIQLSHLKWLQNLLTIKYSVVVSLTDGRSTLVPLLAILEDQTSISFFKKLKGCRGRINTLMKKKPNKLSEKELTSQESTLQEPASQEPSSQGQTFQELISMDESGEETD